MGVCALCANFKLIIKGTKNDDAQKGTHKTSLTKYWDSQAKEQIRAMHHRD